MGHRALIAYERPDSLYNIHYTHWGGLHLRLKHEITPEAPFGSSESSKEASRLHATLLQAYDDETVSRVVGDAAVSHTQVDPDPLVLAVTLSTVLQEYLNYLHHEALYVVDSEFEVTAYRTHWFGLQYDAERITEGPTIGNGAIRTVRWYNGEPVGDGYAQGEFRALKRVVGDLCDRGMFTSEEAREYLIERLDSWVGDEVELVVTALEDA